MELRRSIKAFAVFQMQVEYRIVHSLMLWLMTTMLDIKQLHAAGENQTDRIVQFPVRYHVETGLTPYNMTVQAEGLFRVFGAEEHVRFPEHELRFVRLRILSNVGTESGWPQHQNHGISMAELKPI